MKTAARLFFGMLLLLGYFFACAGTASGEETGNMVLIPAGEFEMGSAESKDETPRTVFVSAFYMDAHEVTQQEFERVTGANPSGFQGDPLPVEQVTWYEARDYCRKVGKRLPTEAEWEKAARGGTRTRFYWGESIDGDFAWYWDNSNKTTHPVGGRKPNAYGLYDMSGNVWEWVADIYSDAYYASSPKRDPKGPFSGKYRSIRGGSWRDLAETLRISRRNYDLPIGRFNHIGFRCARSAK